MSTKIDWVVNPDGTKGETLNVTTGCTKISDGCKNCYAEKMTKRLHAMGLHKYRNGFNKITLHPEELKKPYSWKKPRTVFINSMSDLFHDDVPDEFIISVFKMMNENLRHTFQVLTKRPGRVTLLNDKLTWTDNIWMGVSVESDRLITRIDLLRQTDAKIKFVSFEPLLHCVCTASLVGIDWVIVGGETGAGARSSAKYEWVSNVYYKCRDLRIPFFFKGSGTTTMKKTDPQYSKFQGRDRQEMPAKSRVYDNYNNESI